MSRGPIPRPAERVVISGGRINRYDPIEWELLHDPIWQDILARNQVWIDATDRILGGAQ